MSDILDTVTRKLDFASAVLTAPVRYVIEGPPLESWNFGQYMGFTILREFLKSENKRADVMATQAESRHLRMNRKYPKTTIDPFSVRVNPSVINFLKDHGNIQHWPPEASDTSFLVTGEWLIHENARKEIVYLHAHGGAYSLGTAKMDRFFMYPLSKMARVSTLSIDYRLAPPHPFPCALIGFVSSYLSLLSKGYLPKNIIFSGISAGGGLAMSALLLIKAMGLPQPGAAVLISPWLDLTHSFPSFTLHGSWDYLPEKSYDPLLLEMGQQHFYAHDDDLRNPFVSPVWAGKSHLSLSSTSSTSSKQGSSELPPILLQIGGAERLRDENVFFAHKLNAYGIPVTLEIFEDQFHVFHVLAFLGVARRAVRNVCGFVEKVDGDQQASKGEIIVMRKGEELVKKEFSNFFWKSRSKL